MASSGQAKWLLVTALVLGSLVGLSLLALDRENVIWSEYKPHCPFCRSDVKWYATRCPACDRDFDWSYASDEDSPICDRCLSPGEDEHLRGRRKALGEDLAAVRVGGVLQVKPEVAAQYLRGLGRGECVWCGGTGKDFASKKPDAPDPCPICFGGKKCIACGGDRRVRIGQEGADASYHRYEALLGELGSEIQAPVDRQREVVRKENEKFLSRYAGTREASSLLYWPDFPYAEPELPFRDPGAKAKPAHGAADRARQRVVEVIEALDKD